MQLIIRLFALILLAYSINLSAQDKVIEKNVYTIAAYGRSAKDVAVIQTGFCLKGYNGIFTALHGVAGKNPINAYNEDGVIIENLIVEFADINNDIAFLTKSGFKCNSMLELDLSRQFYKREQLTVVGHPLNIKLNEMTVMIGNPAFKRLDEMIPTKSSKIFQTRNSPFEQIEIIYIQTKLAAGLSGAPLIKDNGKIVGIIDGGIRDIGQSWAIPFGNIHLIRTNNKEIREQLIKLAQFNVEELFDIEISNGTDTYVPGRQLPDSEPQKEPQAPSTADSEPQKEPQPLPTTDSEPLNEPQAQPPSSPLPTGGNFVYSKRYGDLLREELGKIYPDLIKIHEYIQNGADPNLTGLRNDSDIGWTALHECAMQNNVAFAIELVARKANINAKNRNDATPLIIATCYEKWDMRIYLESFKQVQRNIVTKRTGRNEADFTKGHKSDIASNKISSPERYSDKLKNDILTVETKIPTKNDSIITHVYLDVYGADIGVKGRDDSKVPHIAASLNDTSLLRKSFEAKVEKNSYTSKYRYTALMFAADRNSYNTARSLIYDYGVNVYRIDAFGKTALCHAKENTKTFTLIKNYMDSIYLSLRKNTIKNIKNQLYKFSEDYQKRYQPTINNNLLNYVIENDTTSILLNYYSKEYLNYSFTIDWENGKRFPCYLLTFAVYKNKYDVVKFLLDHEVNILPVLEKITLYDFTEDKLMQALLSSKGIESFKKTNECNINR